MTENHKPFKTLRSQLKILRNRGLKVSTDGKPMRFLERIGYYTLINGYKTLFLTRDSTGKVIHPENLSKMLVSMKFYHYTILIKNYVLYYILLC